MWNVESHIQFAGWCALWKVTSGVETIVLQALQFLKVGVCCELPGRKGISYY
jgi:hypothetical protein